VLLSRHLLQLSHVQLNLHNNFSFYIIQHIIFIILQISTIQPDAQQAMQLQLKVDYSLYIYTHQVARKKCPKLALNYKTPKLK